MFFLPEKYTKIEYKQTYAAAVTLIKKTVVVACVGRSYSTFVN